MIPQRKRLKSRKCKHSFYFTALSRTIVCQLVGPCYFTQWTLNTFKDMIIEAIVIGRGIKAKADPT